MRKSKFIPEQILQAMPQAEAGTPVAEICRKRAVTESTFYRGSSSTPGWTWRPDDNNVRPHTS